MIRSTMFIAACICALAMLGATSASAKGGSPGFHAFSHHEAALVRASYACDVRTPRHAFVRTTRACHI